MVAVLFRTLDVLRIYDLPAILTGGGGGSGHATTSLSILVINQIRAGFNSASALSTIVFLLIAFVAFIFVKFLGADVVQRPPGKGKAKRRHDAGPRKPQSKSPSPPRLKGARDDDSGTAGHRGLGTGERPPVPLQEHVAGRTSAATSGWPSSSSGVWRRSTGWSSRRSATSRYTFDTTPWPTHVTLDNFQAAFSTSTGQPLRPGPGQQRDHRRGHDGHRHARRRLRRLRAGAAGLPGQVPHPRRHPRGLDVPRRGPGVPAVPALLQHRLAQRRELPGADHPGHLVRPAADGLHVDGVLQRDAVGARGVGPHGRLHAGAGVPQDHAAAGRARPVHHGDPGLHQRLERVPARAAVLHRQSPSR